MQHGYNIIIQGEFFALEDGTNRKVNNVQIQPTSVPMEPEALKAFFDRLLLSYAQYKIETLGPPKVEKGANVQSKAILQALKPKRAGKTNGRTALA